MRDTDKEMDGMFGGGEKNARDRYDGMDYYYYA